MTSVAGPNPEPNTPKPVAPDVQDAKPVKPSEMSREDFKNSVFEKYKGRFSISNADINKVFEDSDINHSDGLDALEKESAFDLLESLIRAALEGVRRLYSSIVGDEYLPAKNYGSYFDYGNSPGTFLRVGTNTKCDENGNLAPDNSGTSLELGLTAMDLYPDPTNLGRAQLNPNNTALGVFLKLNFNPKFK